MAAAVTNSSIDIALKVVAEAYGASDDVWTKDFLDGKLTQNSHLRRDLPSRNARTYAHILMLRRFLNNKYQIRWRRSSFQHVS